MYSDLMNMTKRNPTAMCHARATDAKLSNSFVLIAAVADAKMVSCE